MAHQLLSASKQQKNSKASRNKSDTNVNQKLLTEFQAVIAFACYDSHLIAQGRLSMRESTIESIMGRHCLSGAPLGNEEDPEILTYANQFLHGLNKFKGLYEDTMMPTVNTSHDAVLAMLPSLHCQSGLNIFVGEGSIKKGLLHRKSLTNKKQVVSGRTLFRLAKEVLCNCKKVMALVTDATSPHNGGSYPFGMNWDDYSKWCLSKFYKSEHCTAKGVVEFQERHKEEVDAAGETRALTTNKISMSALTGAVSTVAKANNADGEIADNTLAALREEAEQQSISRQTDKEHEHELPCSTKDNSSLQAPPPGYFFNGYLAWSLWGHIPIIQGGYKSRLFTDAKENASFGRKNGSRATLKRGAVGAATGSGVDDNKKARTRTAADENDGAVTNHTMTEHPSFCGTTITTTSGRGEFDHSPSEGMIGILTRTLAS